MSRWKKRIWIKRTWIKRMMISVCLGFLLTVFCEQQILERTDSHTEEGTEYRQQLSAWWGVLFPWFCFQDYEGSQQPEISFWVAKVLDW